MIAPACERGVRNRRGPGLRPGSRDERKLTLKFSLKDAVTVKVRVLPPALRHPSGPG